MNQSIDRKQKMPAGIYLNTRARAAKLILDSYEGTNTIQKENYVIIHNEKIFLITPAEYEQIKIEQDMLVFFVRSTRTSILLFECR